MPKPSKDSLLKSFKPIAETTMDKTTRIVREITDGQAEERQVKMARLRKARLERDAKTPQQPASTGRRGARSKTAPKATR